MIITIDGPTASGKSTIARELAKKLNFFYLSSGFLYRAFAYWVTKKKVDFTNIEIIKSLLQSFPFSYQLTENYDPLVQVDGQDVTTIIMEEKIGSVASTVSQIKEVRDYVFNLQHNLVKNKSSVVDGRDCGSKVFPDADIKFFLTASIEARAERLCKRNNNENLETCKEQLIKRDEKDTGRNLAPLSIPKEAIVIDNTELEKEQTLEKIFHLIQNQKSLTNFKIKRTF